VAKVHCLVYTVNLDLKKGNQSCVILSSFTSVFIFNTNIFCRFCEGRGRDLVVFVVAYLSAVK